MQKKNTKNNVVSSIRPRKVNLTTPRLKPKDPEIIQAELAKVGEALFFLLNSPHVPADVKHNLEKWFATFDDVTQKPQKVLKFPTCLGMLPYMKQEAAEGE
jgi:predicted nucleotide-binding protein (sugar kinase/HSP70/actin superfamily)